MNIAKSLFQKRKTYKAQHKYDKNFNKPLFIVKRQTGLLRFYPILCFLMLIGLIDLLNASLWLEILIAYVVTNIIVWHFRLEKKLVINADYYAVVDEIITTHHYFKHYLSGLNSSERIKLFNLREACRYELMCQKLYKRFVRKAQRTKQSENVSPLFDEANSYALSVAASTFNHPMHIFVCQLLDFSFIQSLHKSDKPV